MPAGLLVVLIWVAGRVITTAMMLAAAKGEAATPWAGPSPDYWSFGQYWDSGWYHRIGTGGYPVNLPRATDGGILPNAWAFLPAYPALVGVATSVTGLPWNVSAVLVSGGCFLAATLVLWALLRALRPPQAALYGVALFAVSPLSPVLQVGYAEPLFVLAVALCLLLLVRRRYLTLLPALVLADLSRPGGVVLTVAVVAHLVHRVRRRSESFPVRQRIALVAAGIVAAAAGLSWPLVAWAATGRPDAYPASELAWRAAEPGAGHFVPFTPWLDAAERYLPSPLGLVVLAALTVAFVAVMVGPLRRLGVEIAAWVGGYGLYLFAVFFPQASTFRLLVPMFPAVGALVPRAAGGRVALIAASLAAQAGWIALVWSTRAPDGIHPP